MTDFFSDCLFTKFKFFYEQNQKKKTKLDFRKNGNKLRFLTAKGYAEFDRPGLSVVDLVWLIFFKTFDGDSSYSNNKRNKKLRNDQ